MEKRNHKINWNYLFYYYNNLFHYCFIIIESIEFIRNVLEIMEFDKWGKTNLVKLDLAFSRIARNYCVWKKIF